MHCDHQTLVGIEDVESPIAEAHALIEPLRAERTENLVCHPEGEAVGSSAGTLAIGLPMLVEQAASILLAVWV